MKSKSLSVINILQWHLQIKLIGKKNNHNKKKTIFFPLSLVSRVCLCSDSFDGSSLSPRSQTHLDYLSAALRRELQGPLFKYLTNKAQRQEKKHTTAKLFEPDDKLR